MASTDEGRWLEGIQHPEQHDPLCPESWQPGYYLCICDRLRACEQRVTERHNAEHEDDRLAAFQNGYDAATVKERQRSVLLIADAYGKGLSAARDAVAAECIAHHGYTPGQTCPYCTDALAAIDALRGGS